MPLTNLSTRSRQEVHDWIAQFQKAGDSLTTTDLDKFYYSGSKFCYANFEQIYGLEAISDFFDPIFKLLASMHHEIVSFDVVQNTIYLEATIVYVVSGDPDEKKIKIPAAAVFDIVEGGESDGMIDRVSIYLDPSEVFSRVSMVAEKKQAV
ncbi:hypothetical protein BP5796_11461 [Coleophoma crateriformis]|uniref:SnoaL-like domain-containing protein n=1 Tax=Coleophoma crateriformis TaxID=565419 RepID=A0A3D8QIF5_9HELO|nr:hypothetical protein BP5796_11461 [Coleophoma crateriformis]